MSENGNPGRAAAICEHCGSCHVVRIEGDGSIRVIGTNGSCGCGENDYHILSPEDTVETDAEPVSGEQRGV